MAPRKNPADSTTEEAAGPLEKGTENTAPAEEPTPPIGDAAADSTESPDVAAPASMPDVPVFAPAEEPTPAETPFVTSLPDWLQDNYRQLVDDENRADSFTALAARSTGALAAWARHEAVARGEDITPVDAHPAEADTTRGAEGQ